MGRAPCCEKVGLKKGPWTAEEDEKLTAYINQHGHGSWRALPKKAGLLRCGKSCRLRWTNYLRPDIKRGEFSDVEEQTIIQLHALLGNRWSAIASHLPKRTDNEIKNYWNTHLKKRLLKLGIDPMTHKPTSSSPATAPEGQKSGVGNCRSGESAASAAVSASVRNHMAQWESVRLEAEARLAREAEMRAKGTWPQQQQQHSCHDHHHRQTTASAPDLLCCSGGGGTMSEEMRKRIEEHTNSNNSKSMRTFPSAMDLLNEIQSYCWKKPPVLQQDEVVAWADSCYLASSSSSSSSLAHRQQQQQPGSPTSTLSSLDHTSLTHQQQQQQQNKKTKLEPSPSPSLPLSSSSSAAAATAASATSPSSRFQRLSWTDTLLRPVPPSSSPTNPLVCGRDGGIHGFQAQLQDGSAHSGLSRGDASGFHPHCSSNGALFHAQRRDAAAAAQCSERPSAADDGHGDDYDDDDEDDDDGNDRKSCGAETSFSGLHALMQIDERCENANEEEMDGDDDAGEEEVEEEDDDDNDDREEDYEEEEEEEEEDEARSPAHAVMHERDNLAAAASEDMSSSCTSLQQEEILLHRSGGNGATAAAAAAAAFHDLNSNHQHLHHHEQQQQQHEEEEADEDLNMAGFHYGVISYSALLNNRDDDEDVECYWNSMLKEVEDSDDPILSSI